MERSQTVSVTPWVARLLALNGVTFLLLATVFTAPRFFRAFAFDPSILSSQPWTVLSFMFVHGQLLHLILTSMVLFLFGPMVERRLGSRRFIAYYIYCGVGAALVALCLSAVFQISPFVGASGAVYGVSLAFVLGWPDTPVQTLHVPVAARTLFIGLVVADLVLGLWGQNGATHLAHLGGAFAGYVYFRLQLLTSRRPAARPVPARRPVVTPMRLQETVSELRPAGQMLEHHHDVSNEDIDRVLDKISQSGIDSLTSQERRLLSEAAERKRREQP